MDDCADQMPSGSVTVVNPASWATHPHQLAPLLATTAGCREGSRVVPDTRSMRVAYKLLTPSASLHSQASEVDQRQRRQCL
jgi:kynureninase